jgi:hypothetical protein
MADFLLMDLTPNKRKATTANNVSSLLQGLHNPATYPNENTRLFLVNLAVYSVANRQGAAHACALQI